MPDRSRKTPVKLLVLDAVGYVLFVVGAFVALASHGVHDRIAPFLTDRIPHGFEVIAGAGTALLGIIVLVASDKLKRRAVAAVNKGTGGAGS